ncbi:MAG TPA: hypothetical protein VFI42_04185 [Thermomicrobiaceae bacterium]|nr:hypothetical protein [Thermomicrobiaceae bacterium]
MGVQPLQERLVRGLQEAGFRVHHRSTAVILLGHPDYPGIEARIGTVYLVLARDEREFYRAPLAAADVAEALRRLHA